MKIYRVPRKGHNLMQEAIKNHKKGFFILLLVLAAAAAGAACFWIAGRKSSGSGDDLIMKSVILYGNDDPEDLVILKERLDIFADKGKYTLTQENGCLLLRLPIPRDQGRDYLIQSLEYFLIEPGMRSIICAPPGESGYDNAYYTAASISPDTCTGTDTVNTDTSAEIGSEDADLKIPVLSTDEGASRYFIIRLEDNVSSIIHSVIDKGSVIALSGNNIYQDYDTNEYLRDGWELYADPDDPCAFYIEYDEMDFLYGHEDSLTCILQNDALSHPFNYIISDEVNWMEPGTGGSEGTFQRSEASLGDSWFFFETLPYRQPSADEREEFDRILARRLDYLESPYAIGHTPDGAVCVKTDSDRLNKNILDLLLADNDYIQLYIPSAEYRAQIEYADIRYNPDTAAIEITLPEESLQAMQDALQDISPISEAGSSDLYLITNSGPIARTELKIPASDETFVFKEMIFAPEDSAGTDLGWLADLLLDCVESSAPDLRNFSLNQYYRHEPGLDTYNDPDIFSFRNTGLFEIEETAEKIRDILPRADVSLSEYCSTLIVDMHLETDSSLPDRLFELAPRILEASSLDTSYYSTLQLNVCDERDDMADERAWLLFKRENYGSDFTQDGVHIHFSGLLFNGRMDAYTDRILELLKTDSFFRKMIWIPEIDNWMLRDF